MNLLTDDMITAINSVDLNDKQKDLIKSILYQERQNKEREWHKDAENYISKLIDEYVHKENA